MNALFLLCLAAVPGPAMFDLWTLLDKRIETPADAAAIDKTIEKRFQKNLSVMITDMTGFTARTKTRGIISFLESIRQVQRMAKPVLEKNGVTLLKADADDLFVIAKDPVPLWNAAHDLLAAVKKHNTDNKDDIGLAIGLDLGPILLMDDEDLFGSPVNVASKLGEDTAKAGEILISVDFYNAVDKAAADSKGTDKAVAAPECKHQDAGVRGVKFPFYECR